MGGRSWGQKVTCRRWQSFRDNELPLKAPGPPTPASRQCQTHCGPMVLGHGWSRSFCMSAPNPLPVSLAIAVIPLKPESSKTGRSTDIRRCFFALCSGIQTP